jgi:hypothetical protein
MDEKIEALPFIVTRTGIHITQHLLV